MKIGKSRNQRASQILKQIITFWETEVLMNQGVSMDGYEYF